MSTFSARIIDFYFSLDPHFRLPDDVLIMNPYEDRHVREVTHQFYNKYFNDKNKRIYIIGINAGRFGAGVTGIPFTDPVRLQNECGISHRFPLKPELSSEFIYRMIKTYGGPENFYKRFFLTAVCPLGFTMNGKNLNYYDDRLLLAASESFIESTFKKQLIAGAEKSIAFCLGEGKNFKYLTALNDKCGYFDKVIPLPHPRWIMQYRRKKADEYVDLYVNAFRDLKR